MDTWYIPILGQYLNLMQFNMLCLDVIASWQLKANKMERSYWLMCWFFLIDKPPSDLGDKFEMDSGSVLIQKN